jgi:hypothetical protein
LKRFKYASLKRSDKGMMVRFLMKVSGYSRQQLTRLIQRFIDEGKLTRQQKMLNGFEKCYTADDIQLLSKLDQHHDMPSGFMVKKLCERAYRQFNDKAYEGLSGISVAHIYHLRQSSGYKKYHCHYEKTKSQKGAHIGERRKPVANSMPVIFALIRYTKAI